jgi:hypothetical protein
MAFESQPVEQDSDFEGESVGIGRWVRIVFKNGWMVVGKLLVLSIDIATGGITYYLRNYETGTLERIDVDDVEEVSVFEDAP